VEQIKGLDIPKLAKNFGSATSLAFCCRNVMAAYVYIDAGINVSLPPVLWKWISSVEVV
jgi:hypothetical protein